MINFIIRKIVGSKNQREVRRMMPTVRKINELEQQYQSLSDDDLRAKTAEWKARISAIEDYQEQQKALDEVLPEAFRIDLAVATSMEPGEGMERGMIPGGRCAVLRQLGSPEDLRAAFAFLYGEWWPQSGEEARDAPPFAQRISFFPEVPEHEAVTDLFLPLK